MKESLTPAEVKAYQAMQRKMDEQLVKMGAVKSPATDGPAKAQSPSSGGTTPPSRGNR